MVQKKNIPHKSEIFCLYNPLLVVISQNFPCRAGRGKPPSPPSPSPALSLCRLKGPFFNKKTGFTFPSFTQKVEIGHTPFIEIWAV